MRDLPFIDGFFYAAVAEVVDFARMFLLFSFMHISISLAYD